MAEIGFAELVDLYRHTVFDDDGGGVLHVGSEALAETIRTIEADEALYDRTQIALVTPGAVAVGGDVPISIRAPSHKLGLLVHDFDALFNAPDASFTEPAAYYVIDARYARGDETVPAVLMRYRALLTVIALLREAANYVSDLQRELVFIGEEKTVVPISFSATDLPATIEAQAKRLRSLFDGATHRDEKTGLLADAVVEIVRSQRRVDRFVYLIANLETLCDRVEKGYRLFVSSFSYSKVKKDIETARLDYVGKIHKTIVEIQGQLLGIPVATIVVATQLKQPGRCDVAFWTNTAVLLGAWIFIGLLWLAVRNQRHTLDTISLEMTAQRERLDREEAALRDDFVGIYDDLDKRVRWHRMVLLIVGLAALAGAILATVAYLMLTPRGSTVCLLPR